MPSAEFRIAFQAALSQLEPPPTVDRPVLIILSGLPGTGKSTLAGCLAEAMPAVIVESDFVRKVLFPRPTFAAGENQLVHGVARALIRHMLKSGHNVVCDATNLIEFHRRLLLRTAESLRAPALIVQTVAPAEVVRDRLSRRLSGDGAHSYSDADWEVYQKMIRYAKAIAEPHLRVDTTGDLEKATRRIVRAARRSKLPGPAL